MTLLWGMFVTCDKHVLSGTSDINVKHHTVDTFVMKLDVCMPAMGQDE